MTQADPPETSAASYRPADNGFRDPGPVPATGRANFRGLPNLVGRHSDGAVLLAVVLLLASVGIPATAVFTRPGQVLQAFGLADPVPMVVDAVRPDPDQSEKSRGGNTLWETTVQWDDNGVSRMGLVSRRADSEPYSVGQIVSAVPFPGRAQVTVESANQSRLLVLATLLSSVGFGVGGGWLLRLTGRGRRLLRVVGRTSPRRVVVHDRSFTFLPVSLAFPMTTREHQTSLAVDVSAGGGQPSRIVVHVESDDQPEVGDTLDVWRSPGRGRQMIGVRRASDGTWWVGQAKALAD